MATSNTTTSFISRKVNQTTFLVIEDDSYGEQPYIYIKLYPGHLLITDTGCASPRSKKPTFTSLRSYIESWPQPSNNDLPLNPPGPEQKQYAIIFTHCHYDHILGISDFLSASPILIASEAGKDFIEQDFEKHSLCKWIPVKAPSYSVTHWARNFSSLELLNVNSIVPFRIQFLQTPGHTPDSLSWYDIDERTLYIGDTLYTRKMEPAIPEFPPGSDQALDLPASQGTIIFPDEGGNWIQYMASLNLLLSFIRHQNERIAQERRDTLLDAALRSLERGNRVKVSCGHLTYNVDAETMISEVQRLFWSIIEGRIPAKGSGIKRGVLHDYWEEGTGRYSVLAPRRLAQEARKRFCPSKVCT